MSYCQRMTDYWVWQAAHPHTLTHSLAHTHPLESALPIYSKLAPKLHIKGRWKWQTSINTQPEKRNSEYEGFTSPPVESHRRAEIHSHQMPMCPSGSPAGKAGYEIDVWNGFNWCGSLTRFYFYPVIFHGKYTIYSNQPDDIFSPKEGR